MIWFAIGTALLVLGGVAVVAAGVGGTMAPDAERPTTVLPGGDLVADDLRGIRFTTAVSGYHPQEVDALLERVAAQWEAAAAAGSGADSGADEDAVETPDEAEGSTEESSAEPSAESAEESVAGPAEDPSTCD